MSRIANVSTKYRIHTEIKTATITHRMAKGRLYGVGMSLDMRYYPQNRKTAENRLASEQGAV